MEKKVKDAMVSFMRLVLNQMHPHIDEYPMREIEMIDMCVGDESDRLSEMPYYAVAAYYMRKAILAVEQAN